MVKLFHATGLLSPIEAKQNVFIKYVEISLKRPVISKNIPIENGFDHVQSTYSLKNMRRTRCVFRTYSNLQRSVLAKIVNGF